jgi:hypothetical protein
VGDEDCAVEEPEHVASDALEARGAAYLGRVDSVDVRRAADPLARIEERGDKPGSLAADDTFDADFDHPVASRVEPGHLEIDEDERRP